MEWHHSNSPRNNKFNSLKQGNLWPLFFLGGGAAEVVIFVELFHLVKPFNADRYIQILQTLQKRFK